VVEAAVGPAGRAARVEHTVEPEDHPAKGALLGTWFIEAPGQSPAWRHFVLSCVHLREVPGAAPAAVAVPGATHEFLLLALDPRSEPLPTDPESWTYLTPANVEEQVRLPDDEAALRVLGAAARAVIAGRLFAEPALSGQREPWRSALRGAAAHERGEHAR
jgi:hypothetical protein